jgi:diguanylate cyclase
VNPAYETSLAESELQRGLDCGELLRVYQPIVDVASGEPRYVEALLRWDHPTRGLLAPKDFLVEQEDSTLLIRIGWSVVIEAARRSGDWRSRYPDRPITVSVNLSPGHLAARDLSSRVDHLLRDNEVPGPHALAFEIGEYTLLAQRRKYRDRLIGLRNLGVEIVVDDFGAAAAATQVAPHVLRDSAIGLLESLGPFPLDVVKLDPRFVARLAAGGEQPEFVADVVSGAHAAGLRVVALAVETEVDAEQAAHAGFDLAQGFHFHRPAPPDSVDALLGAP